MRKALFHKFIIKTKTKNTNSENIKDDKVIQSIETSPSFTESESTCTFEHNNTNISTCYSANEESMNSSNSGSSRNQQQHQAKKEDDVALADKEMEERANRAKELLSMRYKGLRHEQVSGLPHLS